jgi:hypothetical protein
MELLKTNIAEITRGLFVPNHIRNPHSLFVFVSEGVCPTSGHEFFKVMYCHQELANRVIEQAGCREGCDDCPATTSMHKRLFIVKDLVENIPHRLERYDKGEDMLPAIIMAEGVTTGLFIHIPYTLEDKPDTNYTNDKPDLESNTTDKPDTTDTTDTTK